jgi:hypothetical protein
MGTFAESYVSRVLFAVRPVCSLDTVARRWRWLRTNISDPYRPELHYMRGPGPKWREKHMGGARSVGAVLTTDLRGDGGRIAPSAMRRDGVTLAACSSQDQAKFGNSRKVVSRLLKHILVLDARRSSRTRTRTL